MIIHEVKMYKKIVTEKSRLFWNKLRIYDDTTRFLFERNSEWGENYVIRSDINNDSKINSDQFEVDTHVCLLHQEKYNEHHWQTNELHKPSLLLLS